MKNHAFLLLIFFCFSCLDDVINTSPSIANQSFSIAEDADNGTLLGTVVATDIEGDALSFTILSGNTNSVFSINSTTGELTLTLANELNSQTIPTYVLSIQVSDGNSTSDATITIEVTEVVVINTPPEISNQTFSIQENSSNTIQVGTVIATDLDKDVLLFTILSGNINDAFELDEENGDLGIITTSALDFETIPSFSLIVEVSDGTDAAQATITVNLTDQDPELFASAEEVRTGLIEAYSLFKSYVEFQYLFDAVYANTIASPSSEWDLIHSHSQTAANVKVLEFWNLSYDLIYLTNNVIISSDNQLSGEEAEQTKGQAKIINAYVYFQLVQWFNNVPDEFELPQESPPFAVSQELLDMTIASLDEANALLPASWAGGDIGKFTRHYAISFKLRVLQFKGWYTESTNWAEMQAVFGEINTLSYSLSIATDDFTSGDSEIIWGFDSSSGTIFDNAFPKGAYIPVIRLTEIYLASVEVYTQVGNVASAIDLLNQLRVRDGLSAVSSPTVEEILAMVHDMYQTEMNFEGLDLFTLKRLDLAISQLSISDHKLLLPIPQSVLESNANAVQNPGY